MATLATRKKIDGIARYYKAAVQELDKYVNAVSEKAKHDVDRFAERILDNLLETEREKGNDRAAAFERLGGDSAKRSLVEDMTNAILEKEELVHSLGFPFSTDVFRKMALVYGITLFEEMTKAYLNEFFLNNMGQFKSNPKAKDKQQKRSLPYNSVIAARSKKELNQLIVDRELDLIGRMSIDRIDGELEDRLGISPSGEFVDWHHLRQAYYSRNLVVHNRGVMNADVHAKIQLCPVKKPVPLTDDLISEMRRALVGYNDYLHNAIKVKLGLKKK
jgi:hypothetical protein